MHRPAIRILSRSLSLLLFTILLNACQTPGPPPEEEKPRVVVQVTEEERILLREMVEQQQWASAREMYLQLAQNSPQPQKSQFLQQAAMTLYREERVEDIETFYDGLGEDALLPAQFIGRDVLLSLAYFDRGKIYQALGTLPDINTIDEAAYRAIALNIRSRGVLAIGKPMESAELGMQIDEFLDSEEAIDKNHRLIWDALDRISERRIVAAIKEGVSPQLRGWLELNLIARRSNMMPATIEPWLDKWRELFTDHPAAARFAPNLLAEARLIHIQPRHIALLLPLSGKLRNVAEAIQNGFLHGLYQHDEADRPVLDIINVGDDPQLFLAQYQLAVQNGADFIVGPLRKELVSQLTHRSELDTPTLTLNYTDKDERSVKNLYQFGLKPEDEAEQVADFALQHQLYHAVTLTPNNDLGQRLKEAFTRRFEALGGRVVESAHYPASKNDYSAAIKQMLNLAGSDQRHSILDRVTGEKSEFIPRRRQDVDMIFVSGNPRQARLIKPQLKFHHAKDLPVYATSSISSSVSDPDADRDLDEILFVDMPWALNSAGNADFQSIRELWPQASERYAKFFALGLDAYRLIPRLRHLMINPEEREAMNTGHVSVDDNGHVHRNLLLATYRRGVARLVDGEQTR